LTPWGWVMDTDQRKYYSISEVAELLDLKSHVLRYWETEFSQLRPRKNRAGNRAYTERDIKIAQLIKTLLHEEKYTIEGARQRLKTNRGLIDDQLELPLVEKDDREEKMQTELLTIRRDIEGLINRVRAL